MRDEVSYPGVSPYKKETDELLKLRYYKYVWMGLGTCAIAAFLPLFLWKFRGTEKIKSLVEVEASDNASEEDTRVTCFVKTLGFNGSYACHYLGCKLLAAFTPFCQYYYLCGFMGKGLKYYGVDVMTNFIDDSDPWPNPADVLFPKMANCEWTTLEYYTSTKELKVAQCQLPMNNLTQWIILFVWWWLALITLVNFVSCLRLALMLVPPYRRYRYRSFVAQACRDDNELTNGLTVTENCSKRETIEVNLSFGDWLVLNFLKKNLPGWKFLDFIRELATTKNVALQLQPTIICRGTGIGNAHAKTSSAGELGAGQVYSV